MMRWFLSLLAIGLAAAPLPAERLPADAPLEQVLDALDARGDGLKTFAADVAMTDIDNQTGDDKKRTGNVVYERTDAGDVRMKIDFTRKVIDGRVIPERIVYLLRDGWLTDRDYTGKVEINRQVLKPGEKIDLLKLGEGPFPLPIGQDKEEVLKQFDVQKLDPAEGLDADDVERFKDTIHLKLQPKAGTDLHDQFTEIEVWIDPESHMPVRIVTLSRSQLAIQITELKNVKLNEDVNDSAFVLEEVQGWQRRDEPFQR